MCHLNPVTTREIRALSPVPDFLCQRPYREKLDKQDINVKGRLLNDLLTYLLGSELYCVTTIRIRKFTVPGPKFKVWDGDQDVSKLFIDNFRKNSKNFTLCFIECVVTTSLIYFIVCNLQLGLWLMYVYKSLIVYRSGYYIR